MVKNLRCLLLVLVNIPISSMEDDHHKKTRSRSGSSEFVTINILPPKETKKDEIADFCRLMIKLNSKIKGKFTIGDLLAKATNIGAIGLWSNEDLLDNLKELYEKQN